MPRKIQYNWPTFENKEGHVRKDQWKAILLTCGRIAVAMAFVYIFFSYIYFDEDLLGAFVVFAFLLTLVTQFFIRLRGK